MSDVAAFLVGLSVGLLPIIYFFLLGPRRFIADTLQSQTTRSHLPASEMIVEKIRLVGGMISSGQIFIVLAAALIAAITLLMRRRMPFAFSILGSRWRS